MKTLRILTIDDEHLALRRLEQALARLPACEHAGSAMGCEEGLLQIEKLKPDVVLLDIRMRDGSGFDILDRIAVDSHAPAIVFVTAYDQFALKAFEANAVDYVLKPVSASRLGEALNRARERVTARDATQRLEDLRGVVRELKGQLASQESPREQAEFWIRSGAGSLTRVTADQIKWVSVEDDYVRLHTANGSYLLRQSIRSFLTMIDGSEFVRVHRKALVRIAHIQRLNKTPMGKLEVELQGGERLPAGRVYAKDLRDRLVAR